MVHSTPVPGLEHARGELTTRPTRPQAGRIALPPNNPLPLAAKRLILEGEHAGPGGYEAPGRAEKVTPGAAEG